MTESGISVPTILKPMLVIALLGLAAPTAAQGPDEGPPSVVVAAAAMESFPLEVQALGNASANESVEIRPVITATLTAIHFREGEVVESGKVLAELENVEPWAELAAARARLADSEAQFKRLSELYKSQSVAESQLNEITARREADLAAVSAAEARLAHTVIKAPFAGRLGLRRVSVGSLVSPSTIITTLDDTESIKLDFDVPEVFLARLETGLEVQAHSAAYSDQLFRGTVTSIDTRVDPVSRTVTVRSLIDNADGHLRAGMFMTVSLLKEDIRSLVVPEEAIVPERSKQYVWVVAADGLAEMREVRTGRRRPGQIEILDGLEAGENVIVEGTQKARQGQAVQARVRDT